MNTASATSGRARLDWAVLRQASARREFIGGVGGMLPLVIGVAPFGFIFGVLALAAGLPWWAPVAMSALVVAGSSQFVAILLLNAGTAYPFIVLTTLVVNLRHMLYGASIAEYLRPLSERWRGLLAFAMTDEAFAVAITHYRDGEHGDAENKHWYFLGANVGVYAVWVASSVTGYFIGKAFGDPTALGLDFALPVVFIAILVPQLRTRAGVVAALVAGAVAVLALGLPNKLGLVLAIAAGILIGLRLEPWNSRS